MIMEALCGGFPPSAMFGVSVIDPELLENKATKGVYMDALTQTERVSFLEEEKNNNFAASDIKKKRSWNI